MATADAGLGSGLRPGLGGTGLELAVGSEGQGWRRSVAVMEAVRQLEAMMREPAAVLDSMKIFIACFILSTPLPSRTSPPFHIP
ncbi:unnamed protein product, partial [Closterium sp. Naga37s-1]